MPDMSTSDSILAAAMELFSKKGYAAVTTKEIAAKAQVNEVTLFRHFETKRILYNKVFSKYIFEPSFEDVFHKQIAWDLSKDLLNIASFFYNIIIRNSKLLQMNIRDSGDFLEDSFPTRMSHEAKQKLIFYFSVMKEKGVVTEEPEILATNFLTMNAGMTLSLFFDGFEMKEDLEVYLDKMVDIFVKGIRA
ncbi:TetR family transcriptional regulator [Hydrogenispora ethanolica]|jgi:AcrR family transcriptional regulator|uniref:TetR family transcriptional regulator n=1 Tax=Hydrogenispora ethanolica TaxID=1082276 RepID=A0A4V2QCD1_HYDET|nr:TetR/AcrR family transcriptional regulator [Hydrogenispora ethanolica]TCL59797.1 TetR family transcriptional regulator [Hydrogenispora ethanolica]